MVFVRPDGEKLARVSQHVSEGKIKCHVERSYNLQEISIAHDYVEEGHTLGKIVLIIS